MTEPAARKSSALKKACESMWKMEAPKAAEPTPRNM